MTTKFIAFLRSSASWIFNDILCIDVSTLLYRDPAIKAMKALGQKNITVMNLFDVMSTPNVLNP